MTNVSADDPRAEGDRLETSFRMLLEVGPDAIVVVDDGGVIRLVNHQAELMFGYERSELVGQSVEILVPNAVRAIHPDHRRQYLQDPRVRPMGAGLDLQAQRKDGTTFPVDIALSAAESPLGRFVCAAVRDITERRRLEAEHAQLERERIARQHAETALRQRDEFVAVAAHELRTPLTTLQANVEVMRRQLQRGSTPAATIDEGLARVVVQTRKLDRLIEQLLDTSRIAAGTLVIEPGPTDLAALVTELIQATEQAAPGIRYVLKAGGPLTVEADPVRIEQAVVNLLANAVRHGPAGSAVTVEVFKRGDAAVIAVSDEGPGIPEGDRARIFERFYRVGEGGGDRGLGLGLYIARTIVVQHGGELVLVPGAPTRFEIRLPTASASRQHAKILIVDDEESIREIMSVALTEEGHEVRTAADGLAALDEAAHWAPDVILLDMRMPRMDGWTFAREYAYRPGPKAVVVVVTAARDARACAAEVGASGHLAKPFLLFDLLAVVERHVVAARRRAADNN